MNRFARYLGRLARRLLLGLSMGCALTGGQAAWAQANEGQPEEPAFAGWQGMRVIEQEGAPSRLRTADLDDDGREELIVVNTRHARLEIYRWLDVADRPDVSERIAADDPNALPMAAELERIEVPVDQLPEDVAVVALQPPNAMIEPGPPRLLVATSVPNKLLLLERENAQAGDDRWRQAAAWDLLPGAYAGQDRLLLLRPTAEGGHEALISFREGIQRLTLQPGARAAWMEPREEHGRADWWLVDIDGDDDLDLVEWTRQADLPLRWYETAGGQLLPPQPLHDRAVSAVAVLTNPQAAAELLLLGGTQQGVLHRYRMGRGEASPLGRRWSLALPGTETPWCGVQLGEDGEQVLVAAPADRPRLLSYALSDTGWHEARSYPSVGDVRAVAAPVAEPGTLLLLTRDAADLHVSRWGDGRFSYPKPMPRDPEQAEEGERRILALETVGNTVWWAQRVGQHLDLYVWSADASEPQRTRFETVGDKTHRARWLGDQRLLVLDQYARSPRLIERDEQGQTTAREPAHLQGADLDQYQLFEIDGAYRPGRLANGVLQWLDDELHPEDQVMLPEGQALVSYLPLGQGDAWALQRDGEFMHRLEPDEAGLPQVTQSIRLPGGRAASMDPVLGLVLHTRFGVTRLGPGEPWELQLLQSVDGQAGQPGGVRNATIHRVWTMDVTGDGRDEALLSDDQRRQLTVLRYQDDELEPLLSWPVYEDKTYPYGYVGGGERANEPRTMISLDIDGDGRQDLAMLAHDRLILYLGQEEEVTP